MTLEEVIRSAIKVLVLESADGTIDVDEALNRIGHMLDILVDYSSVTNVDIEQFIYAGCSYWDCWNEQHDKIDKMIQKDSPIKKLDE